LAPFSDPGDCLAAEVCQVIGVFGDPEFRPPGDFGGKSLHAAAGLDGGNEDFRIKDGENGRSEK